MKRAHTAALLLLGCWSAIASEQRAEENAATDSCARIDGGARLPTGDGASLWYKLAGKSDGPVVLYLHGGPGYNAYGFEKAVGARLEASLRVVYLDQRGCGRSSKVPPQAKLGMHPTVQDIDFLRRHIGVQRWYLIGHSFGGLVALEYERAYPERVEGLILVETTANLLSALNHQATYLAKIASRKFPKHAAQLRALADSDKSPVEKTSRAYELLGRLPLQRQLHFASDAAQQRNEAWDEESGLLACTGGGVFHAYMEDGSISSHPELMKPLHSRAVLFGGRQSNVIGAQVLTSTAQAWEVPLIWFDHSGHFIYTEEPDAFVQAVLRFVKGAPGVAPPRLGGG
jgi:proline iminopeptidase